jgi:hypothetical protein
MDYSLSLLLFILYLIRVTVHFSDYFSIMSDFKAIGKAFVDFYYSKFDTGPREGVAALYVSLFQIVV